MTQSKWLAALMAVLVCSLCLPSGSAESQQTVFVETFSESELPEGWDVIRRAFRGEWVEEEMPADGWSYVVDENGLTWTGITPVVSQQWTEAQLRRSIPPLPGDFELTCDLRWNRVQGETYHWIFVTLADDTGTEIVRTGVFDNSNQFDHRFFSVIEDQNLGESVVDTDFGINNGSLSITRQNGLVTLALDGQFRASRETSLVPSKIYISGGVTTHAWGPVGIDEIVIRDLGRCAGDTNMDGQLTPADFTAWIASFNTGSLRCDQNGDGLCEPADFTAWINNFNAGC